MLDKHEVPGSNPGWPTMGFSAERARLHGLIFFFGRTSSADVGGARCVRRGARSDRAILQQARIRASRSAWLRMHVGDTEPIPRPSGTRLVTHSRTKTGDGRRRLMHLTVADASVEGNRPIAPTPSQYAIEIRCCGSVMMSMKACDTKGVSCVTPRWSTRSHVP